MSSLNYAELGPPFNLTGAFRVLRMESFPSEKLYYDQVVDCGDVTGANELRALIATANSLRLVDFGNGLRGIFGECDGSYFCAVSEYKQQETMDHEEEFRAETLGDEEIF